LAERKRLLAQEGEGVERKKKNHKKGRECHQRRFYGLFIERNPRKR